MRRRAALAVAAALAVIGLGGYLVLGMGGRTDDEGEAAARSITDFARTGAMVDLPSIVPGTWTRVLVVPPYTPEAEITRLAGKDAGPVIASGIEARDDVTVVALLGDKRPVVAEVPNTVPVRWGEARVLSRREASFPVIRRR